jgi:Domain of Unknown Function (DUF1080)
MARKKAFLSRPKTLGLAILLLLLLSSSLFFVTRTFGSKDPLPKKAPVSQVKTSTAEPQQTPEPLYFEDFSSQGKGWYLSDSSGYTRTFVNGALILQDTNQKTLIESLPNAKTYDDFTVSVTFTLMTGDGNDSVGLYLRGDSNLDHDYRLNIYGDDTYALSKESLGDSNLPENTPLIDSDQSSALKGIGQKNTLTVTLQGPTISLTINNQLITSITDNDYKKGQVALFVNNGATSPGVTAAFYSIEISSLPSSLSEQQ